MSLPDDIRGLLREVILEWLDANQDAIIGVTKETRFPYQFWSVRTRHILEAQGITTFEQLVAMTEEDMKEWRQCGRMAQREIGMGLDIWRDGLHKTRRPQ